MLAATGSIKPFGLPTGYDWTLGARAASQDGSSSTPCDEAKLDNIRLERALWEIAYGIAGNEGRAHIVLSGRHTDWEFARDARRLSEELPLPRENLVEPVPPPPLETLIRRVLRHEKPPEPTPAEMPMMVVMAPLDADKVRTYAAAKNVPELDVLIAAIQAANMWEFA